MKWELNKRTGMMEPSKPKEVEVTARQGGIMIEDPSRHIQFMINYGSSEITHCVGCQPDHINLFDYNTARKIADKVRRLGYNKGIDNIYFELNTYNMNNLRNFSMRTFSTKNFSDSDKLAKEFDDNNTKISNIKAANKKLLKDTYTQLGFKLIKNDNYDDTYDYIKSVHNDDYNIDFNLYLSYDDTHEEFSIYFTFINGKSIGSIRIKTLSDVVRSLEIIKTDLYNSIDLLIDNKLAFWDFNIFLSDYKKNSNELKKYLDNLGKSKKSTGVEKFIKSNFPGFEIESITDDKVVIADYAKAYGNGYEYTIIGTPNGETEVVNGSGEKFYKGLVPSEGELDNLGKLSKELGMTIVAIRSRD